MTTVRQTTPKNTRHFKGKRCEGHLFVIGRSKLDLVKREREEGHTVALHSYTHEYEQVYTSVNAYFEDLQKISDAVESIIGEKCDIIRFPAVHPTP